MVFGFGFNDSKKRIIRDLEAQVKIDNEISKLNKSIKNCEKRNGDCFQQQKRKRMLRKRLGDEFE